MELNVVNEINTPKKILALTFPPEITFLEMKEKLIKDKFVAFDDPKGMQIWQSTLKLFPDDVKLNESTLIDGDTIILKPGSKLELDTNDNYIKMALEMGFAKPLIYAAVANSAGNTAQAMTILMETAEQNDGIQYDDDDDDDEFADYEIFISVVLEYLKKNHPSTYDQTIKNPDLKKALSTQIADLVDGFYEKNQGGGKEQDLALEKLMFKLADDFVVQVVEKSEFSNVEIGPSDEEVIKKLMSFGFEREQAVDAYKVTNKDENAALDLLFSNQELVQKDTF